MVAKVRFAELEAQSVVFFVGLEISNEGNAAPQRIKQPHLKPSDILHELACERSYCTCKNRHFLADYSDWSSLLLSPPPSRIAPQYVHDLTFYEQIQDYFWATVSTINEQVTAAADVE